MIESSNRANNAGTLEEHMSSNEVVLREVIGVPEAQIDMSVGGKVEDGIDVESAKTCEHVSVPCYVTVDKGKVGPALQHSRVVPRATIVQFVEGYDVVRSRVLGHQVTD